MPTKVLLKKSSVLGKVPLATDLSYGELALNYADGKLYFKDSNNNVKSFNSNVQLSINDLTDVDTTTTAPNIGQVLKWNGTYWVPGNDETVGGTGTDADTLDGFDSSYFLNYNNLLNKPTIPTLTSQLTNDSGYLTSETDPIYTASSWYTTTNNSSNWDTAYGWGNHSTQGYLTTVGWNDITNKPSFATVATSGSYDDLLNKPTLFSGDYNDLINKPTLFSGSYNDLTDKPTLFSGDYNDLTNKPNIPTSTSELTNDSGYITALDLIGYATESSVNSQLATKQDTLVSGTSIKTINGVSILGSGDIVITPGSSESDPVYAASSWYTTTNNSSNWDTAYGWGDHSLAGYLTNASTIDWSQIINEPTLFSGDYNDLTNKPTIPTVPTLVSAFTNDANYVNTTQLATKQDTLVSGTSIKTINGQSLLGSGDISISGGGSESDTLDSVTSRNNITTNSIVVGGLTVDTNTLYIDTIDNQIGIGTLTPSYDLHLYKPSAGTQVQFESTSNQNNLHVVSTSGDVTLGTWNNTNSTGYVGTADNSPFALVTNNTERIILNVDGSLTINPNGGYTLPSLDGVQGQLLGTSGTGSTSWQSIKTINGQSLLGSGNINISGGGTSYDQSLNTTDYVHFASVSTNFVDANVLNVNTITFQTNVPSNNQIIAHINGSDKWSSIKTINGTSILGTGDITISGGSGGSLYTNTAITSDTSANQVVDTFALVDYRTVKYIIQATSATEVHSTEVTIMHNDVTAFKTEYNIMYSGAGKLFTTAADISGTDARLLVTPLVSGLTIDVTRISLITRAFTGSANIWPTDLQSETLTTIDLQSDSYPEKDLN